MRTLQRGVRTTLLVGAVLLGVTGRQGWVGTATAAPAKRASRGMALPSRGAFTSRYGERRLGFHHGVDIRAASGTPVHAAAAGLVRSAGWMNGIYGNAVLIDHGNGLMTLYGHNSRVKVRPGQRVSEGQVVALSGDTGRTTGPHIHFEVRKNGHTVNPLQYAR